MAHDKLFNPDMAGETKIIRFGVYELDAEAAILRKNGIRVRLQDQPFQILSVLLEKAGEIVTREELRSRLWPEGTFVDFDHSLNASVNKLRDALGDAASNPRFIETVPRRGYRFIAPVERVAAPSPAPPAPSNRPRRALIAGAASLSVVAVLAAVGFWRTNSREPAQQALKVVPLTTSPGLEMQPSFSPDGNSVAYSGAPDGMVNLDIYVKQIGAETVQHLTNHPGQDESPRWSPDGRQIAFARTSRNQRRTEILTVPALGGLERKIAEANPPCWRARFLDWFPDSSRMAIADQDETGERCALFGLDTRTRERWRLTTPLDSGGGDMDPAVSPDGTQLAFVRSRSHEQSDLCIVRLDAGGRPVGSPRVLATGGSMGMPAWTPNGREVLYASGTLHRSRVFRVSLTDGAIPQPFAVATEGSWALSAAISPRWQLAYVIARADIDLQRIELDARGHSISSHRFLHSTFVEHLPEYSPDGSRIAYISNRSGTQQIWVSDKEGASTQQLTFLTGNQEATWPRWSPDGRALLFTVGRSVYVVSAEGGVPTIRLRDMGRQEAVADWSHDGKWIFVNCQRSGRDEICRAPADGSGEQIQLTREGGNSPQASPDGMFVYYAKGKNPAQLWRLKLTDHREEKIADSIGTDGSFTVTKRGIYFITPANERGTASLIHINPVTHARRTITAVDGLTMWGLTVSPERRTVLHTGGARGESDLMLVENFR